MAIYHHQQPSFEWCAKVFMRNIQQIHVGHYPILDAWLLAGSNEAVAALSVWNNFNAPITIDGTLKVESSSIDSSSARLASGQ